MQVPFFVHPLLQTVCSPEIISHSRIVCAVSQKGVNTQVQDSLTILSNLNRNICTLAWVLSTGNRNTWCPIYALEHNTIQACTVWGNGAQSWQDDMNVSWMMI